MADNVISEKKQQQLALRMERLNIQEADLDEQFVKGSGKGGQKINKTSSCVVLFHQESGIKVKCQRGRSQAANRFYARRELCDRLEEHIQGIKSERQKQREKIRRQKRRRSRRQKERMLEGKRRQGEKKKNRAGIRDMG
jgi:protein subunit release factor B